jgi:glycosyltransferase involved in cell wall biosynthesis
MKNKQVALYSNARNASDGGGITYILAIAKIAYLKGYTTTLIFNNVVNLQDIKDRYDTSNIKISIQKKKGFPIFAQVYYAVKEYFTFDVVFEQSTAAPRLTFVKQSYIICDFPFDKVDSLSKKVRLNSWKNVIANSEFTKVWIKNYWKKDSKVLHPPVEIPANINTNKSIDIVSVGRFTSGGRSKNQDVIISIFTDLLNLGITNINLHLIGYVQDQFFLEKLKSEALGFPVFFYENAKTEKRIEILDKSAFFISACGYEMDPLKFPMQLEHYGISVVEAMAHGCIPLVVENGGPKETVDNNTNGIHWNTKTELVNALLSLIKDEALRKKMSYEAFVKSNNYSFSKLERDFEEIIN